MIRSALFGIMLMAAAGSVAAQQSNSTTSSAATSAAVPSGAPATPDLAVASVKLQGGLRISKLLGSSVYNDQNEKIGSVDDLIMKDDNRIVMAVISVGGFLGIGNKLVAVPYDHLHLEMNKDESKIMMPGASKDSLASMPTFTYSG
jgi:sporulation protein YlmC with PRC-barrel domain